MGKMKQQLEKFYNENPDMSDAEYQDWLHSQGYRKVTMEEKQSEHDDWWDSLANEQKQQLFNDQEEAFKLTIEEMNYERE